jgi:hypothetical protein
MQALFYVLCKPENGAFAPTTSMRPDFLPTVSSALASTADTSRAPAMRAYMRDQFDFLGVGTPQRRSACKPLLAVLNYKTSTITRMSHCATILCGYAASPCCSN